MTPPKNARAAEFGDFQTPVEFAHAVVCLLSNLGVEPKTVIEPSCGRGAFLSAAAAIYPNAHLFGFDVNNAYLEEANSRLSGHPVSLNLGNFFEVDWADVVKGCQEPILVLGNPPWVTNSALGSMGSGNVPIKNNFQNHKGLDAITGKSNFDISEWMILQNVEWVKDAGGTIAVLCKTAVARKVLLSAWKACLPISDARIYHINAFEIFGAAVDACLFYVKFSEKPNAQECSVFDNLNDLQPSSKFGVSDGKVISNLDDYKKFQASFYGINKDFSWRSGVKHDCSKVMELTLDGDNLINGYGEQVFIEKEFLYPLFKSSDVSGSKHIHRRKFVIITQRSVGQDTNSVRVMAPKTWDYLLKNSDALDRRSSVIYRNKPRFSIFGIGEYTFAPWKIAISGLYKKLNFKVYGPSDGKPVCFDDTVYFLPFRTEEGAEAVNKLLHSSPVQDFLKSMIFWDEKRPITVDILKRLDIEKLALTHGIKAEVFISGTKKKHENQLLFFPDMENV